MTLEALAKAIRADPDNILPDDASDMELVVNTCSCPECSHELDDQTITQLVTSATSLDDFDRLVLAALRDHRVNDCL
jgi:hypothetical protein